MPQIKPVTRFLFSLGIVTCQVWLSATLPYVARFPAQEYVSGASKIPTIIYYDPMGKVRAVGAEAVRQEIFEAADEGHWVKAQWYGSPAASRSIRKSSSD